MPVIPKDKCLVTIAMAAHEHPRVVHRELHSVAKAGVRIAAIDILEAKDVGDEQRIEQAQPQSRRAAYAVHVQCIEADCFFMGIP